MGIGFVVGGAGGKEQHGATKKAEQEETGEFHESGERTGLGLFSNGIRADSELFTRSDD
jgi:hypothetical protein